jgi:hypothetical protein
MSFLIIPLRIFCKIVRARDRSNKNLTVLQNYFPVNLRDWMTDNQIDMAGCSNRSAERDSVSDAKMKRAELTFIFQFDPVYRKPKRERIGDEVRQGYCVNL